MSIWGNAIKRSNSSDVRKEEYCQVYNYSEPTTLAEGEYLGYKYKIMSMLFPYIIIASTETISLYSGYNTIILKDKSGINRKANREYKGSTSTFYTINYNSDYDYIPDVQDGAKHTIDELKKNCIHYIDCLEQINKNLYDHLD